ncbi:M1 family metallopeptidase [Crocinitomix catalasitica]|uniref:M1 family metallopeptidase n=1 Tax=Crocinitomix catalasitica TaxID=184607 RepID=UPI0004839C37|nr:M1 family metallopeptidase [Crocinitomix catalasitica]
MKKFILPLISIAVLIQSCKNESSKEHSYDEGAKELIEVIDKHSYSNIESVRTKHLHLDLLVDFESSKLVGSVEHELEYLDDAKEVIFDIYGLSIEKIEVDGLETTDYKIGELDELLGQPLTVQLPKKSKKVKIYYSTGSDANALQWLNPQQTAGKVNPYLFTQGQAILTRTWIPCQDSPKNRITYSARIKTPENLMAVMSADNPKEINPEGVYNFKMDQKIPTYLIAMAVGDIRFKAIGEHTGVYAEVEMLDKSVDEFADVDKMIAAAVELYGPYKWGRYDILVLPPSFPFGGMENPKLTFATPTIIAGDKSLVSLIAHELAHSWSGNLVTNATWDDFWLNEGFTVYFENRIMEKVYGKDYADMLMSISYQELTHENEEILHGKHPDDTKLKLDLDGRNPDDGMTCIAYDKGALFLRTLESKVGRDKFDVFVSNYFKDYMFKTISTEEFVTYLNENLLERDSIRFNLDDWIYGQGIPNNRVEIKSTRFEAVDKKVFALYEIEEVQDLGISKGDWSTQEWIRFIRCIPEKIEPEMMQKLDEFYEFSTCGNAEIMAEWYISSIQHGYHGMEPAMENFLINVGRRKFLEPIYGQLVLTPEGVELAKSIYTKARPNYHAISYKTIDEILNWKVEK